MRLLCGEHRRRFGSRLSRKYFGMKPLTYHDPKQAVIHSRCRRTAEVVAIRTDTACTHQGAIDDQFSEGAQRPVPERKFLRTPTEFGPERNLAPEPSPRLSDHPGIENQRLDAPPLQVVPVLRAHCVDVIARGIGPWTMDSYDHVKVLTDDRRCL